MNEQQYYSTVDILSCAQHVEAKKLANKFWTQWSNLSDRFTNGEFKLADKVDKVYKQFDDVRRGINKCCAKS